MYHGKERKSKRRQKHKTDEEATNNRSTTSCGKNSCEGRLHPVGSCEKDQNVASICIQRNKEVQGDGGDGNHKSKQNGRPRISTDRDDRFLTRTSLHDRFKPATKLKEEWEKIGVNASISTIRRRLRAANLSGRVARKKPHLTIAHKRRRLDFAKKHKNWSKEEWERVLWTDESSFSIFGECGKRYVRRRPGEEFNPECVTLTMKHEGGKIQVWGCFTARGIGHIHHITGTMDQKVYMQILIHRMHATSSLLQFGRNDHIIFQHDKDPKHTAKSVENYIKRAKYQVLQNWPAHSPDIISIENLWQELKIRLAQARPRPTNKGELFDIVKREWNALPVKHYNRG